MFTSQVVKDLVGQHYIICLRHFSMQNKALIPEKFINAFASFQFIQQLQVPLGFWESIASTDSFFGLQNWQNSHPHSNIEHYAAEALVNRMVQVYKTDISLVSNQQRKNDSVKDEFGRTYQFQSAANLLLLNSVDKKSIQNKTQAQAFINQLNLSTEEMTEFNQSYNLASTGEPAETLQAALISGDVVVTIQPEMRKSQKATEYIEVANNVAESAPTPISDTELTASESSPTSEPATAEESTSPNQNQEQSSTETNTPLRDDKSSADVLKSSAEEGTPFCEECEKSDQENTNKAKPIRPGPAVEESAPIPRDEVSTAEVLEKAAESGTAFCEECEKENNEKAA